MYSSSSEFLGSIVEFIADGVIAEQPVLAVLSPDKIAAITAELGPAASMVSFADMAEVGANPGRIIGVWHAYLSAHDQADKTIRGIGEPIYASRTPDELAECQLHEVLLNLAFADWDDFWLLCPYDLSALSDDVIAEALHSHPYVACAPQIGG
jgi:MEDS: MEthanogen/methylotroph, DcmR Sensory domain